MAVTGIRDLLSGLGCFQLLDFRCFGVLSAQIAQCSQQKVREILKMQPMCPLLTKTSLHFPVAAPFPLAFPLFLCAWSSHSQTLSACPCCILKLNNQVLSASVQLPACLEVLCCLQSIFQHFPHPYNKCFINLSLFLTLRSASVIFYCELPSSYPQKGINI